jgi:hypothetical protein
MIYTVSSYNYVLYLCLVNRDYKASAKSVFSTIKLSAMLGNRETLIILSKIKAEQKIV